MPLIDKHSAMVERKVMQIRKLWAAGKITQTECMKRIALQLELDDTKLLKKMLRDIDSRYGKKASPVVQGGLPSLDKHQ